MELAQKWFSTLFPSVCIVCRQTINTAAINTSVEICQQCYAALPANDPCCCRCALPLAENMDGRVLCGRCIRRPPDFDYVHSLFRYEQAVIGLIHQLKFSQKITFSRTLGEMLLSRMQLEMQTPEEGPDCLLPVPLYTARLRQRGFNQSIEIARVMAKKLQIPIIYDAVVRRRSTGTQTGLNAKQRQKNIRGAFEVVKEIKGRHVLIIDDVMTTGATVNELSRLLKIQKVKRVGVLCLARAPMKN